ncbi:hypothetical protein L3i22_045880 [Actinoplanes sp. L3-i22]|nr:hypothetical protein L3i22_045880 [Actinoplanes sp. L3-i22]
MPTATATAAATVTAASTFVCTPRSPNQFLAATLSPEVAVPLTIDTRGSGGPPFRDIAARFRAI